MNGALEAEPPFDPRWLEMVAESCSDVARTSPRLEDLYLERRLDLNVVSVNGFLQVEECQTEGVAARWRFPSRSVLNGRTGVSPQAVSELLSQYADSLDVPPVRPVPPPELDAPREWRQWAHDLVSSMSPNRVSVRYISRRAAVIRPGTWSVVTSPALVRVQVIGSQETAVLAVWGHPMLPGWLERLAEPAPQRCRTPSPGKRLPVLFGAGTAGVLIHELIGHMVESDLAVTGASPLTRLKGAAMTAPSINLSDDPTRFDLPGGFSCDDEGVPAEPLPLVQDGVLVGWICDRAGGERLASPPGRGRRSSWRRPPEPRLSNLVLAAGDTDPEDMEKELTRGLLVTRLGGAMVDPVSGRILVRVERGWEIINGRRRRPLAPFELTGNILEVLAHIDPHVGSDPTPDWRLGWCVKGGLPLPTGSVAPSMLVGRLEVL